MRYLLLSDIHANVFALEAVINKAEELTFDEVIFLGDLFGYYPWVRETWDLWKGWNVPKYQLIGNHDMLIISGNPEDIVPFEPAISLARERLSMDVIKHLKSLKPFGKMQNISCFHGSPIDPLNGRAYPDTPAEHYINGFNQGDCIIMGHTHYPMFKTYNGMALINPGSVGQPRDNDPRASYAILDASSADVQFYRAEYDVAHAVNALLKIKWPEAFARALVKRLGSEC